MAYAAVTSLMETLSLHFLQSQPCLPIEDLEAQIRIGNENVGLLHQIVEAQMREMELDEEASPKRLRIKVDYYPKKKKLIKSKKLLQQQLAESSSHNESKLLTSRLREVGEVKQKIVSLHQILGLLQQRLEKSEIRDVRVMKDLEAQIRDASFKLEQRIETELSTIYLAKDILHITASLLRLHQIFNEAEKLTDYQIRDGNENLGLLQQIVGAQIREMELDEEASSSKRLRIKTCLPRLYGNQQLSRLREMGEVKQKIVSLNENLGLLQKYILQKSEIGNDDAGAMKDLKAEMRDVWFKAEERIEMELTTFYLAKDSLLHITACLLRLHQIFYEAQKQTDYHRNELIRLAKAASSQNQRLTDVSLLGRIQQRGLQLVKGSSLHHLLHKKIIVSNFSKNASKFDDSTMVGCDKMFEKVLDQLLTQQTTKARQVVSIVGMGGIGKTTLAHKLYEHPSITSHFDKRAWVTVSQEYNVEQMLQRLLSCVTAASRDDQDQLAESVYKRLKGQRYLIVIDDIWNTTAWDSVQRCFPDDIMEVVYY